MKEKIGNKVRLQIYVSEKMYLGLKSQADPYDDKWESNLSRRAIGEFLERRGVFAANEAEPEPGQRIDKVKAVKAKRAPRSR